MFNSGDVLDILNLGTDRNNTVAAQVSLLRVETLAVARVYSIPY